MTKGADMQSFLIYLCSTSAAAFSVGVMLFQFGHGYGRKEYAMTDIAEDMRAKAEARQQIHNTIKTFVDQPPERKHVAKHKEHTSQSAYNERLARLFCDPLDDDPEHFAERMGAIFRVRCPPTRNAFPTIASNMQFIPCVRDHHKHNMIDAPDCHVWQELRPRLMFVGPDDADRGPPGEPLKQRTEPEPSPPRKIRHVANFGKRGKEAKRETPIEPIEPVHETDAGLLPKKQPLKPPNPRSFHQGKAIQPPTPELAYDALRCHNCNLRLDRTDPCERLGCPINYAKTYADKVQTDDIQDG